MTILLFMATHGSCCSLTLMMIALSPLDGGSGLRDVAGSALSALLDLAIVPIVLFTLVERGVAGWRPLEPQVCSIYQRDFWRIERLWKVPSVAHLRIFDGTPFKNLVWRMLGVKIAGQVFDDGCAIVERTLVSLGRGAILNMGSVLQPHSLEDGVFKSSPIRLGDRSVVGTGGFVHYGVVMEAGAELDADAFLMKGSHLRAGDRWRGNPATEIATSVADWT